MGSGSSAPTTTTVNQNTSSLPAYAQPYYMGLMNSAQALTDPTKPPPVYGQTATKNADGTYTFGTAAAPYDWATPGQRVAAFSPQQAQVQQNILNQQMPGQFQAGSQLAATAGLGALDASQYGPSQFTSQQIGQPNLQQYSMQGPQSVQAMQQGTPQMATAQTNYNPNLNYFQLQGPGNFGTTQAQQYMSPYMQSVVDVQKDQAIRDAQKGQLAQNLGAARQGTYGGARQLLAQTENQRNLNTQLGNIQAQGQQAAFQNAQQQFNTEQAAQQQAAQQNLAATLGVQQLGTQTGMQTALANLSAEQQANVQNQAAQLQQQGLNQQQALQAALANQQMGYNVGQQNLNAALQTQQLGTQTGMQALLANQQNSLAAQQAAEQSKQFGANLGLQGLAQANQSAQTLGNLGATGQQVQSALLGQQQSAAAQTQALQQQQLDTAYQDYLTQQQYPLQMLQQYSSLLHGVPVSPQTTATYATTAPAPSVAAQLLSGGLGTLSMANMLGGKTG